MDRLIASGTVDAAHADQPPASGTPGYATDGNPATGIPATLWPAYAWNAMQEELIALIVAGGLTPDKATNTQVRDAVLALFASRVVGVIGDSRNLVGIGTNTAVAFTADQIVVGASIGGLLDLISNFNATFTLAASGLNGMDNGVAPTSGFVAVYAVKNPATGASGTLGQAVAAGVVAPQVYSGSNPVSGYTRSALIGMVRVSAGLFPTIISGRTHVIGGATVFGTVTVASTPTQASLAPSIIPANAKRIRGNITLQFSSAGESGNFTIYSTSGSLGGRVASDFSSNNGQTSSWPVDFSIIVPGSLWYILSVSTGALNVAVSAGEYDI
jgi:hypothetical protein